MLRPLFISCLLAIHANAAAAEPRFEFKDGDRVALVGDAFIEREQYEGWIELAATTRFADRSVVFRNLGWSADTPAGTSRAGLSPLQAGHEPVGEGWRQLEIQLATYRPSVLVTGYGMAASLPGGQSAEEFRGDFERLLDTAKSATGEGEDLRFLILGAPPRFLRAGETDDTPEVRDHRAALAEINRVLRETAAARAIPFVPLDGLATGENLSQNGIHLNSRGYQAAAREIERQLGWGEGPWDEGIPADVLRHAILRKNEWFFHRSRPANMAYIFGFRKAEQGRNAGEIEGFQRLVEAADARIAALRSLDPAAAVPEPPIRNESAFATNTPQPHPRFSVADGYEITLWAENPLLNKPTQMNFDAAGRLWVASSEVYPQIEVGQAANDKIVILADTNGDGRADSSTVFADGLLIPTGVIPGDGGCYVGQSTDLLHFADTTGDGKADQIRRVLSGFGTEDTHHNLHTLRRGPDGRIWMNQSIYTRTDTETPNGLFRLRSGGVMRFDPRSEDLRTIFYGWCNPWGHQFDRHGQSFATDGAGGSGINWGVPGAMYFTYARAERILGGVSPGRYPKFCGLEIIESPHFPADWQGSMITCDYRAQRIVRFKVGDQESGFIAQEAGDLVRSDDVNFRPIDVRIGPDGALYIADWANPIINHGEVDFRDPRRDREHGRIWRISRTDAPLAPVRDLEALASAELVPLLVSDHRHEREQAVTVLFERGPSPDVEQAVAAAKSSAASGRERLAALWLVQGHGTPDLTLLERVITDETPEIRAAGIRVMGDWLEEIGREPALRWLAAAVADSHPRVRIEAVRLLGEFEGPEPMDIAFRVLDQPMDTFLDYALWLTLRDGGDVWLAALMDGSLPLDGRESALDFALANLPAERSINAIRRLLPKPLPGDGSGPWIGLALRTADPAMVGAVVEQLLAGGFESRAATTVAVALAEAVIGRQLVLPNDPARLAVLIRDADPDLRAALLRLGGTLGQEQFLDPLAATASDAAAEINHRLAAIEGLSRLSTASTKAPLLGIVASDAPPAVRQAAALALVRHQRDAAAGAIRDVADGMVSPVESRAFWQQALSLSGLSAELAPIFRERPLAAELAALTLQSVPDIDDHADFLAVLREQAGSAAASTYTVAAIEKLAELTLERGDAVRGERIYRQPALACVACHAIGGAGGNVGPDMTSIGASAPLDYLIESIVLPAVKVKEGYHSVILETRDGRSLVGQLLRSTDTTVILRDAAGEEITLAADAVVKRTDVGSIMPANLIDPLPEQDQLDLFKFLSELGKPGAFDATKSRAPRVWAVLPVREEIMAAAATGDPGLPWTAIVGTVDGRLPAADLAALPGPVSEGIFAATRLQLAAPTDLALTFPSTAVPVGLWIDGRSVTPGGTIQLEAGVRTIVLRYDADATGSDIRFESPHGTFLPAW